MDIGYSAQVVALLATVISFIAFLYYLRRRQEESIYNFSRTAIIVQVIMLTVAIAILMRYFLIRDFNVEYVANYSDRSLALIYTISGVWAGASGSLLLWAWILSLFIMAVSFRERKDKITGYALTILLSVNIFFISLLLTISNPFQRLSFTPEDGGGLNPLLQNHGMLFHPPTLFIGYAGLTIPFAFALAGLISESELWVFRVRKWMLFSWMFLGLGIWFGGWWSYTVLGWGGYWAWDPVENASLIPWLMSSALLHSVMLQESRRGMKLWNILLGIGTFETVILATFLTRSGVIGSVHSFGQSEIGPVLSTYLLLTLVFSLGVLLFKYGQVESMNIYKSALGKEASFLFNNLFFVLMGLTVIWGSLFPLLNEAVTHTKINVGPGFYNAMAPYILLSLAVLMGFCLVLRWGTTSIDELTRKLKYPLALTGLSIPALYLLGSHEIGSLIGFAASIFAVSVHVEEYLFDAKDYAHKKGLSTLRSMFRIILVRRRRYGGYIVHLSMVIIFIGIIGTSFYKTTYSTTLQRDVPEDIAGYTFTYKDYGVSEDGAKIDYKIKLLVSNGGFTGSLSARMTEDRNKEGSMIVHVGVLSLPYQDIYVIPESMDEAQTAVTINYTPLISLIWVGGIVMGIGVIIGLLPKRWAGYSVESD